MRFIRIRRIRIAGEPRFVIQLHTHTVLSDGVLLGEELLRRCECFGCTGVAVGDHAGLSNVSFVLESHRRLCDSVRDVSPVAVAPAVELTHVLPRLAERTVQAARQAGAALVLGHGETLVEPVAEGSNRAYIEAGVDILAHPGLISPADALLAAERGVALEVSSRKGHCLANGHVVRISRETGAGLVFGADVHGPDDLTDRASADRVLRGAGLSEEEIAALWERCGALVRQA